MLQALKPAPVQSYETVLAETGQWAFESDESGGDRAFVIPAARGNPGSAVIRRACSPF